MITLILGRNIGFPDNTTVQKQTHADDTQENRAGHGHMKMSGHPGRIVHYRIQNAGSIHDAGQSAKNKKDQARRSDRQTDTDWDPGRAVCQKTQAIPWILVSFLHIPERLPG